MNDRPSSSAVDASARIKEAAKLGFYIGAGCGLALGSAVSVVLGSNLYWQASGLLIGAIFGICASVLTSAAISKLRPATATVSAPPTYRR